MKLLRFGPAGQEKPGLLDDKGVIRDLTGHVGDITGDVLGDDEELEYAAMNEAARASLRLLSVEFGLGEDDTPARRVVVSADTDDVTLRPDLDDGAVRVTGPVPVSKIAAVHVDLPEAEHAVREAAGAVDKADLGDMDAEFLVGEAEDHELAWYDGTELPFLVELG